MIRIKKDNHELEVSRDTFESRFKKMGYKELKPVAKEVKPVTKEVISDKKLTEETENKQSNGGKK